MQITKRNYYDVLRKRIPEFQTLFKKSDGTYLVFSDLAKFAINAHEMTDRKLLRKIYLFARQCSKSKEKDIWNAIGVSFFEQIVKSDVVRGQISHYISPKLAMEFESLWSFVLPKKEYLVLLSAFQLKSKVVRHYTKKVNELKVKVPRNEKLIKYYEERLMLLKN